MNRCLRVIAAAMAISAAGCIYHRVQVQQVTPKQGVAVASPVKAHLKDGSIVVYKNGVEVSGGSLRGEGLRYELALKDRTTVNTIPLDSVVGMESFETRVDGAKTALLTTLAVAGGVGAAAGAALLFKAIFGSCPTVYSHNGAVDEAELFSNSIAPALEGRDMDRLRAQPDSTGAVRLEVRNEAMETHYINHLQLLEVQHAADEFVLPNSDGDPVVVRGVSAPEEIRDRRGRDLLSVLGEADDRFYRTDRRGIDGATVDDLQDWIDLKAAVSEGTGSATLVFRMRNSLLSTKLLYETVLGRAGARAIDWLASGISQFSSAIELGSWYQKRAGLHILVWRNGAYREVIRVSDPGPITWHDVAAVIPVQPGEKTLRIRLSFLADYWRIDRIGVAASARQPVPRAIRIARVTGSDGRLQNSAWESLADSDDRYLETNPGQRFLAEFEAGPPATGNSRTFLLSSQGYYTEWIRGSWIQNASASAPFAPSDEAALAALRQWGSTRESFEARFRKHRVPVN